MRRTDPQPSDERSRRRFLREAGATATLAASAGFAGCQGIPFGPGADTAYYHAYGPTLDVDYDGVVAAARDAGYVVDEPYYVGTKEINSGFHPVGVTELDERLGPRYLVFGVTFFYTQLVFLEVWFAPGGELATVSVFDDRTVDGDFVMTRLPPDDWLISQLTLVFDENEDVAREHVAGLKSAINNGTDAPSVDVAESPTFRRTYDALAGEATETSGSETHGDGWYEETFYRSDTTRFATVDFVVQSTKIVHELDDYVYTVKLDRLGGFNLTVELPPGEEMPDSEYRGVFREMFEDVGLPPSVVDDLTFEYTPSVW